MQLTVTVNTIAECLRTDCNILGDKIKKKNLARAAIEFVGGASVRLAGLPTPGAEFAFHLTVIMLSDKS